MAGPNQNIVQKNQLQVSQLEIIFRGPLVKDSLVATVDDLLDLDVRYNYHHKIVWVSEHETNYYLVDGDGSSLAHWKKFSTRLTLELYDELQTYQTGDIVYLSGKLYRAAQNVPEGENPLNNQEYWDVLLGEIVTYRYIFNNQSTVVFYTEVRNPMFEIVIGTFELDEDDEPVLGDDGMVKIVNPEIIEPFIRRRTDLPNNNGRAYEVTFEENSLPVNLTGAINIK